MAEKAAAATGWKDGNILDTLAPAYAEAGDFTNAVRVQRQAIELLQIPQWKGGFTARLRQYEAHSPIREPAKAVVHVESEADAGRSSGASHAQHGRFREAAADFARVLELRPDDAEVWHWQTAALIQSGQIRRVPRAPSPGCF